MQNYTSETLVTIWMLDEEIWVKIALHEHKTGPN